jgi:hypothetical protein
MSLDSLLGIKSTCTEDPSLRINLPFNLKFAMVCFGIENLSDASNKIFPLEDSITLLHN